MIFEESVQWKWNLSSEESDTIDFTVEDEAQFSNSGWGARTVDVGNLQHGGGIPAAVTGNWEQCNCCGR